MSPLRVSLFSREALRTARRLPSVVRQRIEGRTSMNAQARVQGAHALREGVLWLGRAVATGVRG